MVPTTFRRWMWNADFIRQSELNLSRERLASDILEDNGNQDGLEQQKKVLRAERDCDDPLRLVEKIAGIYANATGTDANVAERQRVYVARILNSSYPKTFDGRSLLHDWVTASRAVFESDLNNCECAWILAWSGLSINDVHLRFDYEDKYGEYPRELDPFIRKQLDNWEPSERDALRQDDPYGLVARLVRQQFNQETYDHTIHLGHAKFRHYLATHNSLTNNNSHARALRRSLFHRALKDIPEGKRCIWPSHFCLHMGIISSDNYAILRKRRQDAHMYPGRWEFGVGENMHGPDWPDERFIHFPNRRPDMLAFSRGALFEETGSGDASPACFSVFGFAVEYESLAPKLILLHYSDRSHVELMKGMQDARRTADWSPLADAVPLTPKAIAESVLSKQDEGWGPTSKLCMWLALMQGATNNDERASLNKELNRLLAE
jgi:hypothetical protein